MERKMSYPETCAPAGIESPSPKQVEAVWLLVRHITEGQVTVISEECYQWLRRYPADLIENGIRVAHYWRLRQIKLGKTPDDVEFGRYANGVMRNTFTTRQKMVAQQAEDFCGGDF
jgi:hypothetical protein